MRDKLGKADITLQELYEKTGNELVVTATCVNRRMQRFFHRNHHPDMPVVTAVRMSMSIPLFFVPLKFDGDYYVDGGLLNNFPLWVFGALVVTPYLVELTTPSCRHTRGAGLVTSASHAHE